MTTVTRYVYDGADVCAEYEDSDNDGGVDRTRVYWLLPGMDRRIGFAETVGDTTTFYYYLTDHVGTVLRIVKEDGTVVNQYDYDAFGRVRQDSPNTFATVENRYLFQGREWDRNGGFYYFRNRIYLPERGEFTTPDMNLGRGILGEIDGMATLTFCGGDPVNCVDPTGLLGIRVNGEIREWTWENQWLSSKENFTNLFGGMIEGVGGTLHAASHPIQTLENISVGLSQFADRVWNDPIGLINDSYAAHRKANPMRSIGKVCGSYGTGYGLFKCLKVTTSVAKKSGAAFMEGYAEGVTKPVAPVVPPVVISPPSLAGAGGAANNGVRHPDFNGLWPEYPDNYDWAKHLREKIGPAAETFVEPHAHHTLMKRGRGSRGKALVQEGQEILRRRAGIDPLGGQESLVWAELHAKDIHSTARVAEIVDELRKLDAVNAGPESFSEVLRRFGLLASEAK